MLRFDLNAVFTLVNVLLLCVAVRVFLWKPVHKILEQRQAMVEEAFAEAAKAREAAQALTRAQSSELDELEHQKIEAMATTRRNMQAESDRIMAKANKRAEEILLRAQEDARIQKEEMLRQFQLELAEIVEEATAKTVGTETENGTDLYDAFLERVGERDD